MTNDKQIKFMVFIKREDNAHHTRDATSPYFRKDKKEMISEIVSIRKKLKKRGYKISGVTIWELKNDSYEDSGYISEEDVAKL